MLTDISSATDAATSMACPKEIGCTVITSSALHHQSQYCVLGSSRASASRLVKCH